jgi:hypothetical protein
VAPDAGFPVGTSYLFEICEMNQLIHGHRRFAMLVFVALAWLIPGIARAAAGTADKLQTLLNDTAAQLQLAYRQHPDERARRQEQLTAVIDAWRAAPRSDTNNERLANWLRAAITSSMPGSKEPLPAAPSFAVNVKSESHEGPESQASEKTIEKQAPIEAIARPDDDPFRDDPETENK